MSIGSVIGLITDFGTRDPYVAAMKGVLASRTQARVLDLTHEIAPFDVFEAAFFLDYVLRDFPVTTRVNRAIVVSVVDPGVGTSRRILACADGKRFLIAPDNGLMSIALSSHARCVSLENERFFLADSASTFQGRDRMAPFAAFLANGGRLTEGGPSVDRDSIVTLMYEPPSYRETKCAGTIIAIDRFGNAITDLRADRLPFTRFIALTGKEEVRELRRTYGDGREATPFLLTGSRGTVEISVANGSAAGLLQLHRGDRVELRKG